jgi:hypothetical protein
MDALTINFKRAVPKNAQTEVTVPPELVGYNDGFGQLYAESKLAMDDLIGK